MNRDSNIYTFLFTTAMVLVVAITLATAASLLKDLQAENVRKEKMQNILSSIGIKTDRENSENLYNKYITCFFHHYLFKKCESKFLRLLQ